MAIDFRQTGTVNNKIVQEQGGFMQKLSDFSTGLVKGGIEATTDTARMLQTGGQAFLAGITPGKTMEDIKATTGFKSLQGKEAEEIDAILKSENNAEKAGKLTAFIGSFFTPSGTRQVAGKVAGEAGELLGKGASRVGEMVAPAIDTAGDVARGTGTVLKAGVEKAKQIGSNIKTNVGELQNIEKQISQLPKNVQTTVRQGVDITDAQDILKLNEKAKPAVKKLWNATKTFLDGKTDLNPITAVGKPVVARLKSLKGETQALSNQLTQVAQGLKGQAIKGKDNLVELANNGLDTLGVGVTRKGLNFKGSDLEGIGGTNLIENVYKRLNGAKDAYDLHRLKRFIDSNVEFGKRAEGLTGSAERLLKGWRKQIDTALDTQFKNYNTVNTKLAEKISPLNDLRKFLRTAEDKFDEDLLDLDAGMLMQRIASNVRSNPAIRQTLRNLDKASGKKGSLSGEIDTLVNFYSKLQDYFPEIVNKQSFRGQVTRGVQDVKGAIEAVTSKVGEFAGQTNAVRQKAFKDLLDDLLK